MALNFPNNPGIGSVFSDTTSGFSYEWDGTLWKSYSAASSSQIKILDDISGSFNGIGKTFALTSNAIAVTPVNSASLIINLGGVVQDPSDDYSVSGSNIVFSTAPTNGLSFSGISLGPAVPINTIIDGTSTQGSFNVVGVLSAANLRVTGVSTLGFTSTSNLYISGIATAINGFVGNLTGTATTATTAISATTAGYATTAGISTNVKGTGSRVLYNSATDTTTTSANLTFNGTTLSINSTPGANTSALSLTGVPFGSNTKNGLLGVGTLGFTDSNLIANFTDDVNSYAQVILQNLNSGNAASSDFIVNSDSPLGQDYYGDFGINGTNYAGGGPFGDTSGTYLYAKGGSLSIGTDDAQDFRIATGSGPATPVTRVTIKATSGNVGIGTTLPTSTLTVQGSTSVSSTFTANETRIVTGAEKVHRQSGNTVTLTYNSSTSSNVGYTTNPTGDVTVNVVNIPTSSDFDDYSVTFAVIVNSTGTARTCTAVNLNGVSRTIRWVGGSLSNAISGVTTTNGHTVFSFTGINTVGSASTTANYQVLGTVSGGFW